jgi:hypothetical protein
MVNGRAAANAVPNSPRVSKQGCCQAHVSYAGHLACSGRMEVSLDDHRTALRLFAERANRSLTLCKPLSCQPGFARRISRLIEPTMADYTTDLSTHRAGSQLDRGAINPALPRPRRGVPKLIGFWIRPARLAAGRRAGQCRGSSVPYQKGDR